MRGWHYQFPNWNFRRFMTVFAHDEADARQKIRRKHCRVSCPANMKLVQHHAYLDRYVDQGELEL